MTSGDGRRRWRSALAMVGAVGILLGGIAASVLYSARVELSKGTGSMKSGETVIALAAGEAPRPLPEGYQLTLNEKSSARISLTGKNAVDIAEKSAVTLSKFRVSREQGTVVLGMDLAKGTIKPSILEAAKRPRRERDEESLTYDFQTTIGTGVLTGTSFVGEIVRESDTKYTVDAKAGKPVLQDGDVLIQLASGVTVDAGPPMTVEASASNSGPVLVAYLGAVVFVLQPGQKVQIDILDGRVRLTNLSDQPLYAASWDGSDIVDIGPGGSHEFSVIEDDVDRERGLSHMDDLAGDIGEQFPGAFPPPPGLEGGYTGQFMEIPRQLISPNQ